MCNLVQIVLHLLIQQWSLTLTFFFYGFLTLSKLSIIIRLNDHDAGVYNITELIVFYLCLFLKSQQTIQTQHSQNKEVHGRASWVGINFSILI